MNRTQRTEFELPDDLVIGTGHEDDADARMGAGSTLPQDLYPLGVPGSSVPSGASSAQGRPADAPDTVPATQADALPAAFPSPTPAPDILPIVAGHRPQGRLPQDGPMPKCVLVVDDDPVARIYMRSRLMLRGNVQLLEAANGAQALEFLKLQCFDAVLLDVDMGAQNGYEVCKAVRSFVRSEGGKQPRIYMVTSRSSMLDKMRAKMAGADAFLSKPPHPAELAQLLVQL